MFKAVAQMQGFHFYVSTLPIFRNFAVITIHELYFVLEGPSKENARFELWHSFLRNYIHPLEFTKVYPDMEWRQNLAGNLR